MNYKIQESLKRAKKNIILYIILWLVLVIVFVSPMAYSNSVSLVEGKLNFGLFIENISKSIMDPIGTIKNAMSPDSIGVFFKWILTFTLGYILFLIIGIIRSAPKSEYDQIEHGSSDWAVNGEQYKVLSKKKGIILAENNYLPLDKRGNVNVLVVGRFRFW